MAYQMTINREGAGARSVGTEQGNEDNAGFSQTGLTHAGFNPQWLTPSVINMGCLGQAGLALRHFVRGRPTFST